MARYTHAVNDQIFKQVVRDSPDYISIGYDLGKQQFQYDNKHVEATEQYKPIVQLAIHFYFINRDGRPLKLPKSINKDTPINDYPAQVRDALKQGIYLRVNQSLEKSKYYGRVAGPWLVERVEKLAQVVYNTMVDYRKAPSLELHSYEPKDIQQVIFEKGLDKVLYVKGSHIGVRHGLDEWTDVALNHISKHRGQGYNTFVRSVIKGLAGVRIDRHKHQQEEVRHIEQVIGKIIREELHTLTDGALNEVLLSTEVAIAYVGTFYVQILEHYDSIVEQLDQQ